MIKFITTYQAEIIGAAFFALLIFALLIFNGVIGARPKSANKLDEKPQPGDNLKRYTKIDSDF